MQIIIAPDSFKGSLSAKEVATAVRKVTLEIFPDATLFQLPFSDGGEGALGVLQEFASGTVVQTATFDPLGRMLKAPYYLFDTGHSAWIELSQSSGLTLLSPKERNPLLTSTYGTGILIKDALERGCKNIFLGIGGSATHDLGTGIFMALGGRILNKNGALIGRGGGALQDSVHIDTTTLDPKLKTAKITIACDVSNPLLGSKGAANTYASQKGATTEDIEQLEKNSHHLAEVVESQCKIDIKTIEGGGAAGGTGAGMFGLLGARLESGFSILAELSGLEGKIKNADLVITGEGHFDQQSSFGKVPFRITQLAQKYDVPTVILAGKVSLSKNELPWENVTIFATKPDDMPLERAMRNATGLIHEKLRSVLKDFKKNQNMN